MKPTPKILEHESPIFGKQILDKKIPINKLPFIGDNRTRWILKSRGYRIRTVYPVSPTTASGFHQNVETFRLTIKPDYLYGIYARKENPGLLLVAEFVKW